MVMFTVSQGLKGTCPCSLRLRRGFGYAMRVARLRATHCPISVDRIQLHRYTSARTTVGARRCTHEDVGEADGASLSSSSEAAPHCGRSPANDDGATVASYSNGICHHDEENGNTLVLKKKRVVSAVMAVVACCVVSTMNVHAAMAGDYESTTYEQMQQMAKPFKKQKVNKGRVWLLFVLGASSLFGVTVLVENNSAWFPAIAKANKAMKASMKAMEEQEKMAAMEAVVEREKEEEDRLENAVLAGIQQASSDARQTLEQYKQGIPRELDAVEEDVVEEEQEKTPLFEISGEDIDKNIEERMQGDTLQVEDSGPDLSSISAEELQRELDMRQKNSD